MQYLRGHAATPGRTDASDMPPTPRPADSSVGLVIITAASQAEAEAFFAHPMAA